MSYNFFALMGRMKYIDRWGLMRNTQVENIQEHSHMVAVLSHALAVIGRERFGSWESAYGQGPDFNIQRTGRFPGGTVTFRLDVKKGVIRRAAVSGDFFSTLDGEAIGQALTGCRYQREAVREALEKGGVDGAVYRVSAGELARAAAD